MEYNSYNSHKIGYATILLKGGRAKLMSVKALPLGMAIHGNDMSKGEIISFSEVISKRLKTHSASGGVNLSNSFEIITCR